MTLPVQAFIVCLVSGLILFGAEIFVPGGILGLMGGMALLAAVVTGFVAFGMTIGAYAAGAIVVLLGIALYLWITIFPRTRLGRKMTVATNLSAAKATQSGLKALVGKTGVAQSDLRPAGFALIDEQRIDVVTQGGMIDEGERIRVVEVEGNRVVVRKD